MCVLIIWGDFMIKYFWLVYFPYLLYIMTGTGIVESKSCHCYSSSGGLYMLLSGVYVSCAVTLTGY